MNNNNNAAPRKRAARVPKPTLASVVTTEIREAIVAGRIPPGTQMNEAELATRFSTSRGPVREGLQRLLQEGLLVSSPHRGIFVSVLSAEDLEDVYFARYAVEHAAMVRVIDRGISAASIARLNQALGEMELAVAEGDSVAVAATDMDFHRALVSAAGSPRLDQMYESLLGQMRLGLTLVLDRYENRDDIVPKHRAILQLLKSGDRDAVLTTLDEHLRLSVGGNAADDVAGHGGDPVSRRA